MKKARLCLAVLLCAFFSLSLTLAPEAPAGSGGGEGVCEGDANGDGQTDVLDLIEVLINFGLECPEPPEPCDADVNGDGVVNVQDLIVVLINFGCGAAACIDNSNCDDGVPCTIDLCLGGSCFHIPIVACE